MYFYSCKFVETIHKEMNINIFVKAVIFASVTVAASTAVISCKGNKEKAEDIDSTKIVTVNKPGTPIALEAGKKYVYFTVDDGPQPPGTNNCLNVFKNEKIKATFFMIGLHQQFGPSHARIVDTIRNSYPEILLANHSMTHGFRNKFSTFYKNVDSAYSDFLAGEKELQVPVKILRFPGMNTWVTKTEFKGPKSSLNVAQKVKDNGFSVIGWDLEWNFAKGSTPVQGATQLANQVQEKLNNQATNAPDAIVILAHDRMFAKQQYSDSLTKFIQLLKQDPAIVFETIDHYPTVQ